MVGIILELALESSDWYSEECVRFRKWSSGRSGQTRVLSGRKMYKQRSRRKKLPQPNELTVVLGALISDCRIEVGGESINNVTDVDIHYSADERIPRVKLSTVAISDRGAVVTASLKDVVTHCMTCGNEHCCGDSIVPDK